VVELPFAADCCPWVEKLRTVLPLTVGFRDSVVHLTGVRWAAQATKRTHKLTAAHFPLLQALLDLRTFVLAEVAAFYYPSADAQRVCVVRLLGGAKSSLGDAKSSLGDAKSCRRVTLRARWVTLRARWVTLRARWVTLRARWVTLRARWVTLRARWVTLRARWVTLRARWVTLRARWVTL
jgi:hypothetical protein